MGGADTGAAALHYVSGAAARLWLDNASLVPEKTVDGWRCDVVEAVKALKPGIIRFGGSALDDSNLGEFDWRDTIGDPDKRKPFLCAGVGFNHTGPGLEEIVQFCRHARGRTADLRSRVQKGTRRGRESGGVFQRSWRPRRWALSLCEGY